MTTSQPTSFRRRALLLGGGSLAALHVPVRAARTWPEKPLRLIVPFTPGGASDVAARTISAALQEAVRQTVIVEYKPGANGNLGADFVAKSGPDGHTLLVTDVIGLATSPFVYARMAFDPVKDLRGVSLLTSAPHVLVVNPALPVKNLQELVALSKRSPLNCAVSAVGSPPHLACVQIQQATGAQWQYVPYKGGSQAITDTISGQTQLLVNSLAPTLPHIQNGRLKAIAISSPQRMPLVPDFPTLSESGIPGFESGSWQGVLASNAVPADVLAQINAAVVAVARSPDVRARVAALGARVVTQTPQETDAFFLAQMKHWGDIATKNGIRAE